MYYNEFVQTTDECDKQSTLDANTHWLKEQLYKRNQTSHGKEKKSQILP